MLRQDSRIQFCCTLLGNTQKCGQIQCETHIISFLFTYYFPHLDIIKWTTMAFMAGLKAETRSTFLPVSFYAARWDLNRLKQQAFYQEKENQDCFL